MARTVFVGLSGGVDSAVSAAILREQGFDVVGVFIKIWQAEFIECTWKEDRLDALRVAAALGIPFKEIDLSDDYMESVVSRMLDDYKAGITPNPDVLCNKHIKFGSFASWALRQGADAIATGHYARVREQGARYELLRGLDLEKDQSYFLHTLKESDLARALFPVGGLRKSDVRALAAQFDLPVRDKPDSQGLCFVGDVSMSDFLKRFIEVAPGPVVDMSGKKIGEHEGAALYTVGQRHGFSLSTDDGAPHYVVSVDIASNTVRVSARREDAARKSVFLRDIRSIGKPLSLPSVVEAQTRYREAPVNTQLIREGARVRALFRTPHVVSPGQSLVMYDKDHCLGGGIIDVGE
jgi:tRNA-specific 2-thiouridylase